MKDRKESHPIYIAIDATKIARCKWCGTAESEDWRGVYCSTECQYADSSLGLIFISVFCVICSLVLLASDFSSVFIGSFLLLILMACPILICGVNNLKLRQKIPKDSRRSEAYSDTALLKALPSMVSCPRCDGNIDLTELRPDRSYACDYCGASGTIEIVKTGRT